MCEWLTACGHKRGMKCAERRVAQEGLSPSGARMRSAVSKSGVSSRAGRSRAIGSAVGWLQSELREEAYRPQPVRQVQIPKAGKPGEFRTLGIRTIYDRVCQQAVLNRLEPIFEPVLDRPRRYPKLAASNAAGAGRVLLARPRPYALPQARWLDRAAYLVASFPALAVYRVEAVAIRQAVRRPACKRASSDPTKARCARWAASLQKPLARR
jgi:hypothetical protein